MRGLDISALRRKLMETLGTGNMKSPDAIEISRTAFECREFPVDLLLRVATVASRVADFPDTVVLREHAGYRQGLSVVRNEGVWRLDGGELVPSEGDVVHAGRSDNFQALIGAAYKASTGKVLPETAFGPWDADNLKGQLTALSGSLPPHVVHASLGRGNSIATTVGLVQDPAIFAKWIDAVTLLGHDIDETPAYGVAPALFALMNSGKTEELETLISRGAEKEAVFDGDTALMAAISGGKVDAAMLLMSRGAKLSPDRDGYSPLRRALDSFDSYFQEELAVAMTGLLLNVGENPYLSDFDGRSPAEEAAGLVEKLSADGDSEQMPEALQVIAMYEETRVASPTVA